MSEPSKSAHEQLRLTGVEATGRLVDALSVRGFDASSHTARTWRGFLPIEGLEQRKAATIALDIRIPKDYPFAQPRAVPLSRRAAEEWAGRELPDYLEASWSWHRERDGALCLFDQADHGQLPWAEPAELFDQIESWLREDLAGWHGDPPALDLERYLEPTGSLVMVGDLRTITGQVVSLTRSKSRPAMELGRPVKVPRARRGMRAPWPRGSALVLDVGELTEPIRSWSSLVGAAGEHGGRRLEREVENGVRDLILLYTRSAERGVLALRVAPSPEGWTLKAHQAAGEDISSLTRRAHIERGALSDKRVTIVGVGAVGSVVADLLHRSGVGHLHLIDPEVLLPGNAVRHLCPVGLAGQSKVEAVAAALKSARPRWVSSIECSRGAVATLDRAVELLSACDLVVDATADSTASRLLAVAARAGAGRAVSVCVLADGYAIRADHWPEPPSGGLPAPVLPPPAAGTYETGCSSPVSTTPPAAAWEAAALGARHAIQALLDHGTTRPEERVLAPGIDR